MLNTNRARRRTQLAMGLFVACGVSLAMSGPPQDAPPHEGVVIPSTASALEGIPTARVESTSTGTMRRTLDATEAKRGRLLVRVRDGRLYWASRGDAPLTVVTRGEYTYLAGEPGHYIRLRRVSDRITYVEHVDAGAVSVTYWGELRIAVGKQER